MFVLEPVDQITAQIEVNVPVTAKKTKKQDFQVTFKKLSVEDAKELGRAVAAGDISEDEMLIEHVLDIEGVRDVAGEEIPFTEELLRKLLNIEYVRGPLSEMFQRITLGPKRYTDLQRKN